MAIPEMDITEKVNKNWTFLLLLTLALISLVLPEFISPAACHTPAHFITSQVDYANAFCAFDGKHHPLSQSQQEKDHHHQNSSFSMLVWAPCTLAIMAFATQFPFLICQLLHSWFGIRIQAVVAEIQHHYDTKTIEHRMELLKGTVQTLALSLRNGDNSVYFLLLIARKCLSTLISLSLFVVLQILTDPFSYIIHKEQAGPLRSKSLCTIETSTDESRTHQCIYPANLILQKLFIFLLLYLICLFLINFFDLIMWAATLFIPEIRDPKLATFIYSTEGSNVSKGQRTLDRKFASFLGFDGFYLLKTINHELGESAWAEVSILLWRKYQDLLDAETFNDGMDKMSVDPFDLTDSDVFKDKRDMMELSSDNIELNVLAKQKQVCKTVEEMDVVRTSEQV